MLLKVLNGTPKGGCKSLCRSCRNATIVGGGLHEIIECSELSRASSRQLQEIQPIHTCTYYDDKSRPSLANMKNIAWELMPNKRTGKLGFAAPEKRRDKIIYDPVSGRDEW